MRYDLIKEQETFFFPAKEKMIEELQYKNLGYDFEKGKHTINMRMSEDKIKLYYLADKLTNNYGDISKVNKIDYADFWTYSFPCTDISVAGKQLGINESTRSGLLLQVQRLLGVAKDEGTLPKYLMLENVKNLVGKKFKEQFDEWVSWLDELGYNTYWQILNAKDYGIPQNRERVFGVSIRKDIDYGSFYFQDGFDNGIRLKDMLDDEVDESFYISQEKVDRFITSLNTNTALLYDSCQVKREGKSREYNDYSPSLSARDYKDPRIINCTALENKVQQVGNIVDTGNWDNPQRGRIYSIDGCSPALNCCGGGGLEPKILTHSPYVNKKYKEFEESHGYIPELFNPYNKTELNDLCPTLTAQGDSITKSSTVLKYDGIRVRKLTPKECLRLMGFYDEDFEKIKSIGMCNSQIYKQAGNSIVVDVMCSFYKVLFKDYILTEYINNENFTYPQVV